MGWDVGYVDVCNAASACGACTLLTRVTLTVLMWVSRMEMRVDGRVAYRHVVILTMFACNVIQQVAAVMIDLVLLLHGMMV